MHGTTAFALLTVTLCMVSMATANPLFERVRRQVDEQKSSSCSKADIVFVLDSSGSIGSHNWELVLKFTVSLVENFTISENGVRFGLLTFSNRATIGFHLNEYTDLENITAAILATKWKDQKTNTSGGIYVMRTQMFGSAAVGDREGVPNVAVVITDGVSTVDSHRTYPEAGLAKEAGIIMVVLGVTNNIDQKELEAIGSEPSSQYVFNVENFADLTMIRRQLVSSACDALVACSENADIVFVLDGSGSVSKAHFMQMITFIKDLLEDLNVGDDMSRVAAVSFSDSAVVDFYLNNYTLSRSNLAAAFDAIIYPHGTTNTANALKVVREQVLGSSTGNREIVVVFTDGNSNDYEETLKEAKLLRLTGATILVAGITDRVDTMELNEIASDPDRDNMVHAASFDDLPDLSEALKRAICNDADECAQNPCLNSGTCVDGINIYYCKCPMNFAGVNCEIPCSNPKDVVLSLDASGSIGRENFLLMEEFAKGLARTLPIDGEARTRMGVQTYSTDATVAFNLNQYSTKRQVSNAISMKWTEGATNSAAALQSQTDVMFATAAGARSTVEKVGIFLSDGHSSDRAETFAEAMRAHERSIRMMTVSVAVTSPWDLRELRGIASDPNDEHMFHSETFASLADLTNSVVRAVCNEQDNCAPNPCNGGGCVNGYNSYRCQCSAGRTGRNCQYRSTNKVDVIFMVDMSGSIRQSRFALFLKFVTTLVAELDFGSGDLEAARVGMITFNDDVQVQFRLDAHKRREDVVQHVESVVYRPGKTNIADALAAARTLFTFGGGRPNVPHFGILLTDGQPTIKKEMTLPEAIAARVSGIHLIVAAVELKATDLYLRGIASAPIDDNVVAVSTYQGIDALAQSVQGAMIDETNECNANPCENDMTCVDGLNRFICMCTGEWTGATCARSCSRQRDVLFVLDASGSMVSMFDMQMRIAKEVVVGLNFDGSRTRVGVITYSDEAAVQFHLNAYTDQQSVLNAIAFVQQRGYTNTAGALDLATSSALTVTNGLRDGVDTYVVVMSDGHSNVNEQNTIPSAMTIKNAGARIIAVGVKGENAINRNEVNGIASNPDNDNAFFVQNENQLETVAEAILDQICA